MMLEENETTKKRMCEWVSHNWRTTITRVINIEMRQYYNVNPRISLLVRCMKLRNAAVAVNKFLIIELLPNIVV